MAGARWAALAVVGAIAVGVIGCGSSEDGPKGTDVAILTPGARDDVDWTRQTAAAVERAAKRLHVKAKVVDGTTGGSAGMLRKLARSAQLVIAPSAADRAAAEQVAESTNVPVLVWGDPKALRPGLVGNVEADFVEALYTAGAVAVHSARERSVGIVMCDDDSAWEAAERFALAAAFVKGARAMDPKARAAYGIAGADEASAKDVTIAVAKQGIQIILDICGTAAAGVMAGVERVGETINPEAMLVSLVGDKATINRENSVVTGVIVNPAVAFEQALRDIRADRFGERVYTLNQANRGTTVLQTGRTPSDAYEAGLKLKPPTDLPTTSDEATLDEVIAE